MIEEVARALALARLRQATADGAFDVEILADKKNYRRSGRFAAVNDRHVGDLEGCWPQGRVHDAAARNT